MFFFLSFLILLRFEMLLLAIDELFIILKYVTTHIANKFYDRFYILGLNGIYVLFVKTVPSRFPLMLYQFTWSPFTPFCHILF